MIRDALINEVLALPLDERRKLIEIISESMETEPKSVLKERIPGLSANSKFWMSPDFNESLFSDDWMDDPSDTLNWNNTHKENDS